MKLQGDTGTVGLSDIRWLDDQPLLSEMTGALIDLSQKMNTGVLFGALADPSQPVESYNPKMAFLACCK